MPLTTDYEKLLEVLEAASEQHQRLDCAADAILAQYVVPRRLRTKIVRDWLIDRIWEYRHPEPGDPEGC